MKGFCYRAGTGMLEFPKGRPEAAYYERKGEPRFRIDGYDSMPPFLMSIVSDSDIWLFISSRGGLTAGRGGRTAPSFPTIPTTVSTIPAIGRGARRSLGPR